ncbi:hypothetical protein EON80_01185 [bacterium]|nr:MAG: hypothetical protein EON80_01185 [bacterium]
MSDTIAHILDEASHLPIHSDARNRLEDKVLEDTEIVNMEQVATLVEAVARRAAYENGASGDEDSAQALLDSSQTISEALRRLHEIIQSMA